MRKTAFIGHREIFSEDIDARLIAAVETEIGDGCKSFTMGTHGQFDALALWACRQLRKKYRELEIEVVLTSLNATVKDSEWDDVPYADVNTVMYDIEEAHFKQRITLSNRQMIDTCDTLICYVNEKESRSGAKTAMRYANRKGLKIVNLWRDQDQSFYGMTKEEIDTNVKEAFQKVEITK